MFGWRRRSEGFEWKDYVRTTVLVRRADRQRRIEDARVAAIEKVKNVADAGVDAGLAGAAAAKNGFFRALSVIGWTIADVAIAVFWLLARWARFGWNVVKDALLGILAPLGPMTRVAADAVREKLSILPALAKKSPLQAHHLITAALVLGLIYIGGPMLRSADGISAPVLNIGSDAPVDAAAGGSSHRVTVSNVISGAAAALSGDVLRVDGTLVRLEGIEAPAAAQPCYRDNGRRWNCAFAARAALNKVVRGHQVTCTASGQDSDGRTLAHCLVDGSNDIAVGLVRDGYAFATDTSFFGSLSSEESSAKEAKRGIWQGEVVRPQAWRDQAWEAAKRDAPDGCPIKGVVRASAKIYALPWSEAYAEARVRTDRGGRWFCSEDEAKAAGFAAWDKS
ncbi:thermonuclease family protein [Hyphomicrobium sp.]|uniref:thermonuclease family protein n=1 Tax=Hyphomicrobium sp. TaxID=82 RepID=UPI000FA27E6C|nr:thermonuclease family protein [Hyphomicrobium sp.]RUO98673.1 MAG: thermonuclease family protein [Hyphomicrobium sp.]